MREGKWMYAVLRKEKRGAGEEGEKKGREIYNMDGRLEEWREREMVNIYNTILKKERRRERRGEGRVERRERKVGRLCTAWRKERRKEERRNGGEERYWREVGNNNAREKEGGGKGR